MKMSTISHTFFLFSTTIQEIRKLFHCCHIHSVLTADAEKASAHMQSFQGTQAATLPGQEQFCRRAGKVRRSLIMSNQSMNPGKQAGGISGHTQEI